MKSDDIHSLKLIPLETFDERVELAKEGWVIYYNGRRVLFF
jgi:hypothetical protein